MLLADMALTAKKLRELSEYARQLSTEEGVESGSNLLAAGIGTLLNQAFPFDDIEPKLEEATPVGLMAKVIHARRVLGQAAQNSSWSEWDEVRPSLSDLGTWLDQMADVPAPVPQDAGPEHVGPRKKRRGASADAKFGRWETLRRLPGKTGQGDVWEVIDPRRLERGALKLQRSDKLESEKARQRFQREMQVTRSLNHPCIVKVLDAVHEGPSLRLVTEWAPLGTLHQQRAVFRGDAWRSLRIARDVALGLAAAHSEQVIHRDIKPKNILLRSLDSAMIADFGIAHTQDVTLTSTDEHVAPFAFGPPEAADGRLNEPPPNFDVYSLGKVIYFALSGGKVPSREDFEEEGAELSTMLDQPSLVRVNDLLRKMIVKDPGDRLQTMEEVVHEIDLLLLSLFDGTTPGRPTCSICGTAYKDGGCAVVSPHHVQARHKAPNSETFAKALGRQSAELLYCPSCGDVRVLSAAAKGRQAP